MELSIEVNQLTKRYKSQKQNRFRYFSGSVVWTDRTRWHRKDDNHKNIGYRQLEEVHLTVYVPEDKYGQIQMGRPVIITTDSFPSDTFDGQVIRIADKAEFTPRNIQTVEGRLATVCAVEILVPNPDNRLKSGMSADVAISMH